MILKAREEAGCKNYSLLCWVLNLRNTLLDTSCYYSCRDSSSGEKKNITMEGCRDLRFIPGATHLVVVPSGSGNTF